VSVLGAGGAQVRQRRPCRKDRGEQVELDHGMDVGHVDVFERRRPHVSGVVDQDVEAAERGDGLCDHAFGFPVGGEVGGDRVGGAAALGDQGRGLGQRFGAPAGQGQYAVAGGQFQGQGTADPAACPGDEGAASMQVKVRRAHSKVPLRSR
jgi:hypothetical protein